MSESKPKLPKRGGLSKARQKLKELRAKKAPSSGLIRIIDEVTHQTPGDQTSDGTNHPKKEDIAALPVKRHRRDLDL